MPAYPWLMEDELEYADVADRMRALKKAGVPYSQTQAGYEVNVEKFGRETADKLNILAAEENLIAEAQAGNFDGDRARLTEMDALVAYLQMLGTLVDFGQYEEGHFAEFR